MPRWILSTLLCHIRSSASSLCSGWCATSPLITQEEKGFACENSHQWNSARIIHLLTCTEPLQSCSLLIQIGISCTSRTAAGGHRIRLWSKLLEMYEGLKRWTQTWRKCPLVTRSLHQLNRAGFMLGVECFFVCPLLCGLFLSSQTFGLRINHLQGMHFIYLLRQTLTLFKQHETEDYYLLKGSTWLGVWDSCPEDAAISRENRHSLTPD